MGKISATQEILDTFYHEHGPCCAGCDWWRHINSLIGDCTRTAPVPGEHRASMLGIVGISCEVTAGHIVTHRDHLCGEFKDEFDWTSLPLAYLRRIGFPHRSIDRSGG